MKTTKKQTRKQVFGHSVAAVARRLGKAGMKASEVIKALRKRGVKNSEASIAKWVSRGKNGLGKLASLKAPELKSLKGAAA